MRLFTTLSVPLLALAALAWLRPAAAQDALPPGPGHDETVKVCGNCHGVDVFLSVRRSQPQWDITIQNMIGLGATISDADYDVVLTYLTTNMGLAPRPKPAAP